MKVLVDISVWSMALRRPNQRGDIGIIVEELKELIKDLRVLMIGLIRQELLSGIADEG